MALFDVVRYTRQPSSDDIGVQAIPRGKKCIFEKGENFNFLSFHTFIFWFLTRLL